MKTPSIIRILLKDFIDFFIVVLLTALATLAIYYLLPSWKPVELSFYFFEQFIELFFVNPKLMMWFLGLGLGISIIYFLLCAMLKNSTVGCLVARLVIHDQQTHKPLAISQAFWMAIGAYFGVVLLMLGPLSAWWLNHEHRGWSEKLAGVKIVLKLNLRC